MIDNNEEKQQLRHFKQVELSPAVKVLLADLRQHESFRELLHYMQPVKRVPRYSPAKHESSEEANAEWIFWSGNWAHYEHLYRLFTGEAPKGV